MAGRCVAQAGAGGRRTRGPAILVSLALIALVALFPGAAQAVGPGDEDHLGPQDWALIAGPQRTATAGIETQPYDGVTYWPLSNRTAIRNTTSTHDYTTPIGSPVYAIRDGIVTASTDLVGYEPRLDTDFGKPVPQNGYYSYGRYIKIVHPDSPGELVYAHLSERIATSGQTVRAGQLIGYSGNTGYSSGPHLHIDWNGQYYAVTWLKERPVEPTYPGNVDTRIQSDTFVQVDTGAPGATVLGNLTVVSPVWYGFTAAFPCADGIPRDDTGAVTSSVNNYGPGQTTPNFAAVKADRDGMICFYAKSTTHLLWDESGETWNLPTHLSDRKLDTRGNPVPSKGFRKVSLGRINANKTILGNLTVVNPAAGGFTTAYPCLAGLPKDKDGNISASVNNFVGHDTTPNFAAVKADANGDVCFYTSTQTDLLWDQVGEVGSLTSYNAKRLLDSRLTPGAKVPAGTSIKVHAGAADTTVFGNLTVTAPESGGFTSAYSCATGLEKDARGMPTSSVNNFTPWQTTPNFAAVRTDVDGDICFYTSSTTHLIWDQVSESDQISLHPTVRLLDSR